MLSGEGGNTNFIVFDLTWPSLEATVYLTRLDHGYHYTTDAVRTPMSTKMINNYGNMSMWSDIKNKNKKHLKLKHLFVKFKKKKLQFFIIKYVPERETNLQYNIPKMITLIFSGLFSHYFMYYIYMYMNTWINLTNAPLQSKYITVN